MDGEAVWSTPVSGDSFAKVGDITTEKEKGGNSKKKKKDRGKDEGNPK